MGGLFALTGVLALAAIWVVAVAGAGRADAARPRRGRCRASPGWPMCSDPELLRLNFGIFVLHVVLMAMFVVVPPMLVAAGLRAGRPLEALPAGGAGLVRADGAADPLRRPPQPAQAGAGRLASRCWPLVLAALGRWPGAACWPWRSCCSLSSSPSTCWRRSCRRWCRASRRRARAATAIGVYNTAQTLGLFFGGLGGGWIAGHFGAGAVFGACAGAGVRLAGGGGRDAGAAARRFVAVDPAVNPADG